MCFIDKISAESTVNEKVKKKKKRKLEVTGKKGLLLVAGLGAKFKVVQWQNQLIYPLSLHSQCSHPI